MTQLTLFQGRLLLGVGAAVMIALPGNWMMQLAAFALLSAGALAWQSASRWFFYASVAADVMLFFVLLGGTPVLGPGLAHIALSYAGDAVQWITGCLLLRACGAVMCADGRARGARVDRPRGMERGLPVPPPVRRSRRERADRAGDRACRAGPAGAGRAPADHRRTVPHAQINGRR